MINTKRVLITSLAVISLAGCSAAQIQQANDMANNVFKNQNPTTGETQLNKKTKYGLLGAGGCALAARLTHGGGSGKQVRNSALGCGALGLIAGAVMDNKEAKLRQDLANTGVGVERRDDGRLLLTMPDISFESGSSNVSDNLYPALNSVSKVIGNDLIALVNGHTDSSGPEDANQILSEKRARSVSNYLIGQGVPSDALTVLGSGESQPVASNGTVQGRKLNRRVELVVEPKPKS